METFINTPSETSRPAPRVSSAQLATRQKFKMAMHFLSPLATFLNSYYRPARRFSSGYTAAFSELVKFGIKGEYPVLSFDFEQIGLSHGRLSRVFILSALRKARLLELTWRVSLSPWAWSDDEAVLLIYNETKGLFSVNRRLAQRAEAKLSCWLPDSFETDVLHFYLLFVSRDGRDASDSFYLHPTECRSALH